MITIGSHISTGPRDFSIEDSKEILAVWQRLTKKASEKSLEVASRYGKLDREDPEWEFLAREVNQIIQDWASKIRRLGGEPRELWTIAWNENGIERIWQLEPDRYVSLDQFT